MILKSLGIGYALVGIFFIVLGGGEDANMMFFVGPIYFWPATLIVAGLVFLGFKSIEEQKAKK